MLRDKKPGKPEDDPTTSLGASMLRRRLLQILSRATGITTLFKSNASNLHESESPNLVVSRKILVEGPPQNVVADLNWDQELQLMKVAYEERGTPYHFCREDYQRNIRGIPMNKHCQMMCVGPDLNVGGKHQHAIVTCGFNQQCCGKAIWGIKGNNQYPSVKERRLVLNEAFSNVQHDDKGVSLKSPYYELGTPVNWSFRGQWLSGKIIAHYPGDNDSMPYLVREDIRMWGHEKPHRLIYVLNDDVKKIRPHDDDVDDSIAVLSNQHQSPPVKSKKILPVLIKESASCPAINDIATPMHIKIVASSSAISDMISMTSAKTDSCRTLSPRSADGPPILSNSEKMVLEYYANIRSMSSLPPPSVNPNAWGTSSASEKSVFNCSTRSNDTEESSQKSVISTSSPPPSTPAVRSRRPTLTNTPLKLSKVAADRSQSPTRKDISFRCLSERESIRVRRESIVSIDSVRSRDDESHVDIDQLIVDYLSETDEQSDEQMEERMQEEESVRQQSTKDEEANTLARNALEEFETTGDGEN